VSALHVPVYAFDPYAIALPLEYDPEWRAAMKKAFEEEWCKPLRESGLRYRMEMQDGRPASVIADVAEAVDADLVVVGRRGLGGVAELLIGSVSHELSHHCKRPVLLISGKKAAAARERAAASARDALAAKQEALAAIEEAPLA
jgi:nucleotide-binding universal stress UspA family protein